MEGSGFQALELDSFAGNAFDPIPRKAWAFLVKELWERTSAVGEENNWLPSSRSRQLSQFSSLVWLLLSTKKQIWLANPLANWDGNNKTIVFQGMSFGGIPPVVPIFPSLEGVVPDSTCRRAWLSSGRALATGRRLSTCLEPSGATSAKLPWDSAGSQSRCSSREVRISWYPFFVVCSFL